MTWLAMVLLSSTIVDDGDFRLKADPIFGFGFYRSLSLEDVSDVGLCL